MAWTYSGNPSNSSKDAVRFLIADTKVEDSFVTDEEIEWSLVQSNTNIYGAAAIVARALSAQFSTLADEEIGPLRFKYAERAKNYEKVAIRFENSSSKQQSLSGVYAGGIDVADKDSQEADSSLVQPSLFKGMTDYVTSSNDQRTSE